MQTIWKSDDELFAIARRELFTAVVGDISGSFSRPPSSRCAMTWS
jgi:hypothetical protein